MKRVPSRARRRRGRPANKEERARRGARRACSESAAKASHRPRYGTTMVRTIAEGNARRGTPGMSNVNASAPCPARVVEKIAGGLAPAFQHARNQRHHDDEHAGDSEVDESAPDVAGPFGQCAS